MKPPTPNRRIQALEARAAELRQQHRERKTAREEGEGFYVYGTCKPWPNGYWQAGVPQTFRPWRLVAWGDEEGAQRCQITRLQLCAQGLVLAPTPVEMFGCRLSLDDFRARVLELRTLPEMILHLSVETKGLHALLGAMNAYPFPTVPLGGSMELAWTGRLHAAFLLGRGQHAEPEAHVEFASVGDLVLPEKT